ncbi:type II secretion system protein [Candidatus Parcubacteria bacterium]|jgi:type II secretory pathway pseudopilin PulG|nr:type II secretion system protein [Candidatus Parcubacteria bacterium]
MLVDFLKKQTGFTMPTLMLTIAVVLLLATSVLVTVNPAKRIGKSKNARRLADITAIAKAVETYAIDNHQLPSDFSTTSLSTENKFVLCSSEGALTCNGETWGCLVVDDDDFLGVYLPTLPVDPSKSDASDTGYYVTRKADNMLAIGSCDTYNDDTIQVVSKAALPDYVALPVCGNLIIEGNEACDDGDRENETQTCGNGIQENGTYCNSTCTAVINLTEACDDGDTDWETCGNSTLDSAGTYCNPTCTSVTVVSSDEWCDSNGSGGLCIDEGTNYYSTGFVWDGINCTKFDAGCSDTCHACIWACGF